ncbi:MAG: class I SAM-dependent methyltransferase [Anaerolineales bacterium]|nr:class I SAM-dependent methyltransferase [Anaerolineales bacterium]
MRHVEAVQSYFDKTQLYLARNTGIQIRAQIVRELLGEIENSRILDLGCGDGSLSIQFLMPSNHITLLDVSKKMLMLADQKIPVACKHQIALCNLDFLEFTCEQPFDLVLCVGVLAHASSIQAVLQTINRLLRPGGRCLLQFSDQEQLVARITSLYYEFWRGQNDSYTYRINSIRRSEMQSLIRQNNFLLIKEKKYWAMLPGIGKLPTKVAYRFLMRLSQNDLISSLGGDKIWLLIKE